MSASITPIRPVYATPPRPYRFMTVGEARSLTRGSIVELWDGSQVITGFIQTFTEDAMNVAIVSPYSDYTGPAIVALELFDADLEDGPSYPPRTKNLSLIALRFDVGR